MPTGDAVSVRCAGSGFDLGSDDAGFEKGVHSNSGKEGNLMQATTDGSVIIEFMPRVGSVVEFLSDLQTEKGPSSGTVLFCDWNNHTCVIRHSDHPGETFDMKKVQVVKFVRRNPNDPQRRDYWGLR